MSYIATEPPDERDQRWFAVSPEARLAVQLMCARIGLCGSMLTPWEKVFMAEIMESQMKARLKDKDQECQSLREKLNPPPQQ